eukprot:gene14875-biopygen1951
MSAIQCCSGTQGRSDICAEHLRICRWVLLQHRAGSGQMPCYIQTGAPHCAQQTGAPHCAQQTGAPHCAQQAGAPHCAQQAGAPHCAQQTGAPHCAQQAGAPHCAQQAGAPHCAQHTGAHSTSIFHVKFLHEWFHRTKRANFPRSVALQMGELVM